VAGQPPEPSFQPSGQDQGLTQSRPAWHQPSYPPPPPPPAAPGGQQGYAAPSYGGQEQAYAAPAPAEPAYSAPDQGYAAQDPSYGNQDQAYPSPGQGQGYQGYQGYQSAGYGAQAGQDAGTAQWQGTSDAKPKPRARARGEKGFLGSLFDFSFNSFVTPKIIKVLYILFTIWTALVALSVLIIGFRTGGVAGGLFTLIIIEPILVLLWLGIARVVLEAFMVIYRMYEEIRKLRENSESAANRP
jgi:Domain of unknown function (DUF4282)